MIIQNSAEGGTNGTTVTSGNSGGASGDAWNTVSIGASGATFTFSNIQTLHGAMAYRLTSGATADSGYLGWTTAMAASPTMYLRAHYYFTNAPTSYFRIAAHINSSFQIMGGFGVSAANKFIIRNSAGTLISTSTTSVPTGQWIRLEFMTISSATVGQMELKIFLNPAAYTPDETLTTTATQNTRGGNINTAIFGADSAVSNADFHLDSLAVQDIGYIGPVQIYAAPWIMA